MGIQSLERLPEAQLRALPPPVQSQLRAIRGLRSASRSMGLGSLAFDDASEFIAMLRDNVGQQKERLAEAERYRSTHAATAKLAADVTGQRRLQTDHDSGVTVCWRRGAEILPLHAAQKRLAFAGLLSARLSLSSAVQVDQDVVSAVCERVVATDRASVLLAEQRRRVQELEAYTKLQVEVLQGLVRGGRPCGHK